MNKKICIKRERMIDNEEGNGDTGKWMTTEIKNSVEQLEDKVGETSYKVEQKGERDEK